jgi:hypothetical protein
MVWIWKGGMPMRLAYMVLVGSLVAAVLTPTTSAQPLTDPHEILNRHFEACGGLDRMRAERSQYLEGQLSVAGLSGPIKIWSEKPHRLRAEADLGILKMTQGDQGEYTWVLDSNGKVQKTTNFDEATARRREVQSRATEYEFADPNSDVFDVTLIGVEMVGDAECYVVRIDNNINDDIYRHYINTQNFHLEKSYLEEAEYDKEKIFSDYRTVDGLLVAFHAEETTHPVEQTEVVTVTTYESNPEIDPALFEAPEQAGKDYTFAHGDSAENIPFSFIGNHIYIPVAAGGKERLWILDTGAGMSVIQSGFAAEIGLALEGSMTGQGAGGLVEASFAEVPAFSMPGIRFDSQTMAVVDMHELDYRLGLEFAGILGFDFLSRFVTRVDFANELVSFYEPESFEYSGDGHVLDVHIENGVMEVPGTIDGSYSGYWLFDLGASFTGLDNAYAYVNGFRDRPGVESLAHGAGNEYRTKAVRFQSFEFAGYTLDRPRIGFPIGGENLEVRVERIGTLGNNIFRHFVLTIDYARERIIVEKGDNYNQRFPEDRSGISLRLSEAGDIVVSYVSEGTPGDKAGVQAGDVIRAVNGIGEQHLDGLNAVRELLKSESGTRFTVAIERDGARQEVKLELADLL